MQLSEEAGMFTDDTRIGACLEVIVTIRYLQITVQIFEDELVLLIDLTCCYDSIFMINRLKDDVTLLDSVGVWDG